MNCKKFIQLECKLTLKKNNMRLLFFIEKHGRRIFIAFVAVIALIILYFAFDAVKEYFINAEKYLKNLQKF